MTWHIPVLISLGLLLVVSSANAMWPTLLPWGIAFWLGWGAQLGVSMMWRTVERYDALTSDKGTK